MSDDDLKRSYLVDSCVLQPWVMRRTMMQQTVLMTAIRGPDGLPKYGPAKMLLRWYRRCILKVSFGGFVLCDPYDERGGSFTGPSIDKPRAESWQLKTNRLVVEPYLQEIDAIPHHFQLHLLHAAEIVGFKHPVFEIYSWWARLYERLVSDMHLKPETEAELDRRLGDDEKNWRDSSDIATQH